MREILFKGKRKDNGEWVCGEYITIYDDPKYKAIKTCIELNTGVYEVDPDTVCQYTGLTDRNGTKIFENDIVTITGFCPDDEGYGVIQWADDEAMFVVDADYCNYDFGNISGEELEVIGNVVDNLELIHGVEE
jgi:uncharacterized phage protein (TIGR01671 family)